MTQESNAITTGPPNARNSNTITSLLGFQLITKPYSISAFTTRGYYSHKPDSQQQFARFFLDYTHKIN